MALPSSTNSLGTWLNARVVKPEHRRNAIDDRGDDCRHTSKAEDHHRRNEVDPGRYGLHHVENRTNHRLQCLVARAQDAYREGDEHGDQDSDRDQGEGLHRCRPQPHEETKPQAKTGKDCGAQTDGDKCQDDDDRDKPMGRHEEEGRLESGKNRFDQIADRRKQRMKVGVEPID